MKKFYDSEDFGLEQEIEEIFSSKPTVTEALLRLNGVCSVAIKDKYEFRSRLEPHKELKDGIVYTQTRYEHKDLVKSHDGFENPEQARFVIRSYLLHRNARG